MDVVAGMTRDAYAAGLPGRASATARQVRAFSKHDVFASEGLRQDFRILDHQPFSGCDVSQQFVSGNEHIKFTRTIQVQS